MLKWRFKKVYPHCNTKINKYCRVVLECQIRNGYQTDFFIAIKSRESNRHLVKGNAENLGIIIILSKLPLKPDGINYTVSITSVNYEFQVHYVYV